MKEEVLKIMEKTRQLRLARQYHQLLKERTELLKDFLYREFAINGTEPLPAFFPPLRDLFSLHPIKAILNSPEDVVLTTDSFARIGRDIIPLLVEHQARQKNRVRKWFQEEKGIHLSTDVSSFDLAIVSQVETYPLCGSIPLFEHYFIADYNNTRPDKGLLLSPYDCEMSSDLYETCMDRIAGGCHWKDITLGISLDIVKWVIEAAGEDPSSATTAAMDRKTIRWYCTDSRCCGHPDVRVIMNWRAVVSSTPISVTVTITYIFT